MVTEAVGAGLTRALYSTYLSFLRPEQFTYEIPKYDDPRGVFVEMLKTRDAGQFSYFTAHPGITRGGHYHHSSTSPVKPAWGPFPVFSKSPTHHA